MGKYSKEELFEIAIKAIQDNNLVFVEDLVAFLPIGKDTYYRMFPLKSEESEELKRLLSINKVHQKLKLRKKWLDSDNPATQLALYKLIGTDEERKRLSQTFISVEGDEEKPVNIKFKFGK